MAYATVMDRDATTDAPVEPNLTFEVRPTCFICERLSVTFDQKDRPLCARHATIFMVDHTAPRARGDAASASPSRPGVDRTDGPPHLR